MNDKKKNLFEKYGLDFTTLCNCNSRSIYVIKNLFEMKVLKGKFPLKYVETDVKSIYTIQPEKFQKVNCDDYSS